MSSSDLIKLLKYSGYPISRNPRLSWYSKGYKNTDWGFTSFPSINNSSCGSLGDWYKINYFKIWATIGGDFPMQ